MGANVNLFGVSKTILATAVANGGTFTIGYPAGLAQGNYTGGLGGANNVMIVNDNDRYGPSQFTLSFGPSNITVTQNTGFTLAAGTAIAMTLDQQDGNNVEEFVFPVQLVAITAAADVVTDRLLGVAGTIEYFALVLTTPVTTAAKLATFNLEIGTTDVTGGVIAVTSALATPMGKVLESTPITGNNVLTAASKISIEATAVTAFSEGQGYFVVRVRRAGSNYY